jgi:hypothetical protein
VKITVDIITEPLYNIIRSKRYSLIKERSDMKDMGMTDSQFKAFVRFLVDAVEDAKKEEEPVAKEKKLEKILSNLQSSLED